MYMDFMTIMESPTKVNFLLVNTPFILVYWNQSYNIYNNFLSIFHAFCLSFFFFEELLKTDGANSRLSKDLKTGQRTERSQRNSDLQWPPKIDAGSLPGLSLVPKVYLFHRCIYYERKQQQWIYFISDFMLNKYKEIPFLLSHMWLLPYNN